MTQERLFGLYGTGGFAREVMPLARRALEAKYPGLAGIRLVYVEHAPARTTVGGFDVLSHEDFVGVKAEEKIYNVAIANSKHRRRIHEENSALEISIFDISCASHKEIGSGNKKSPGGIYCTNTVLTSDSSVGVMFHCNIYSYVAHDCIIGNYVTFAPRVSCNGNVEIGDDAYIGAGAIIRQGDSARKLTIGQGAIVGMGAIVTKDVPAFTTVVGNPARVLRS